MVRKIFVIFGFLFSLNCLSKNVYFIDTKNLDSFKIPNEFKETGLISSSTYQIYIKIKADSYEEALNVAKKEILEISYYYISLEPFMYRNISPYGKQKIMDFIKTKGRFVYIKKNREEDVYEVVFHIFEIDLKNKIKEIR